MTENLTIFHKYIKHFVSFSGIKIVKYLFYAFLTGVTQGVGIFMLIPFLNVIGISGWDKKSIGLNRISKMFIDTFNYCNIPLNLLSILILFMLVIIITKYINYKKTILSAALRNSFIGDLQAKLFKSVIFAEWQFISNERSSNLSHVVTTDLPSISGGTFFFLKISASLVLSTVYFIWAMFISVELSLFTLIFAGLSFVFIKKCLPHSINFGQLARNAKAEIYSILLDHIHGLKIAKSYCAEDREYDNFKRIASDIADTQTNVIKLNSRMRMIYAVITYLLLCIFLYVSISILNVQLASLFLLIVIFSRLMPNISSFQNDLQHVFSMLPSFKAMESLLHRANSHQENIVKKTNVNINLKESVKLNDVSFSYHKKESGFSIKNLNIEIPALKTSAIIGESGTGKSTLVDIITGILKLDSGSINIDNVNIDRNNLYQWRQIVGYLPQEVFLFHDTLKNNILWSKPDASEDEIIESLKLSSAYDFVMKLPDKLDTVVKDRGIRLSGGERQRVALARTLIRKPQLLILDEATSSLDKENEARIYESIAKLHGKMTIVFITHRQETLKFADKVIDISECIKKK